MSKVISSFCSADKPQCVEVEISALSSNVIVVTDSKENELEPGEVRGRLAFTLGEWEAFIAGVKAGEFDYDALKVSIPA